MRKKLASLVVGLTLLTVIPTEVAVAVISRSNEHPPIPQDIDFETVVPAELEELAQNRRIDPERRRRIRRRIIRGVREHRRRRRRIIKRKIRRAIRRERGRRIRRRIIRGIIGNRICRDRGGYWENDRCYYNDD